MDKEGIELKYSRTKDRKPDCESRKNISIFLILFFFILEISSAQPVLVQDCTSSLEPGPCTSSIPYWNFNEANSHCSLFNYSGCGGNGNKFGSRLEWSF